MSATNNTTYYNLPIFIGTDVPSWLGDWNNAMNAIDSAIQSADSKAQGAKTTADETSNGLSTANETISSMQKEIQTIKQAVQNYDSILDFEQVPVVASPNNLNGDAYAMLVQNTNKTLAKLQFWAPISPLTNPTTYTCTTESGTTTWLDLFTVEDNCFNLNQSSLPNTSKTASSTMTIGLAMLTKTSTASDALGMYILAWFDGVTTHIGITSSNVTGLANEIVSGTLPIFLSGSVYNPDDPNT